jgi:hypothetical protein
VIDFEHDNKETKREKLRRLLQLLNGTADSGAQEAGAVDGGQRSLKRGKVPVEEIRRDFYAMIDEDAQLRDLFDSSKMAQDNL